MSEEISSLVDAGDCLEVVMIDRVTTAAQHMKDIIKQNKQYRMLDDEGGEGGGDFLTPHCSAERVGSICVYL